MRHRATITLGLLVSAMPFAATQASAQDTLLDIVSGFYDSPSAPEQTPAPLVEPLAPMAEPPAVAGSDGWETTLDLAPQLVSPPQEVRVPRPRLAARPDFWPADVARPSSKRHALSGIASFYWQGQMTASGERFDKSDMTAAHRSLPFGTRVRVSCKQTGRDVVVRINDRGPFKPGRVIDLSEAAAEKIGMRGRGLTKVDLEVLQN